MVAHVKRQQALGLGPIYRSGYPFSKCSILLMDLSQRGGLTPDLFAPKPRHGAEQLMAVVDQINRGKGEAPCALAGCQRSLLGRC